MKQKITWMLYLHIGISIILFTFGCGKEDIEYRMTVDLLYINKTDSLISFEIKEGTSSNIVSIIKLQPSTNSQIFSYDYEGVDEKINTENCCNDFLQNVYSNREMTGSSKTIRLNDSLCVIHFNDKSTQIANYKVEEISDRHYKYIYTFTKDDFEKAKLCE